MFRDTAILKGVLRKSAYVIETESGREFAKGVVTGIVASLISAGDTVDDAIAAVKMLMPDDVAVGIDPVVWREEIQRFA